MSVNEVAARPLLDGIQHSEHPRGKLAVMLPGGGARAAYQVGLLRGIARHFPHLRFDIITGVSAGAINAAFLAAQEGTLGDKVNRLAELWSELECRHVFQFDAWSLIPFRSALNLLLPKKRWSHEHGLVDTTPLRKTLERVLNVRPGCPIEGIARNIRSGDLHALALITLDYSTGQSVRWVQGRSVDPFEGASRRNAATRFTVEHVLASSALPFLFPAIRIGSEWHGDGGIRLAAPLSAPLQLGATRILAMSTTYLRTDQEASIPVVKGYPPTAQILSQLFNAIFLDAIDEDVTRMERLNQMLRNLEPHEREGLRPIDLCVLRPSVDLGRVSTEYERYLPLNLKLLTRALGAGEKASPDFVSLLLFQPEFLKRLIEIGESDVEGRLPELAAFFGEETSQIAAVN